MSDPENRPVSGIVGLDHVLLAMPAGREDEARAFYQGLLGLPEKKKPAEIAHHGGVWFETDRVKVHLGIEKDFRPARKAHPGLLVRGLRPMLERLRAAGQKVGPDELLDGRLRVFVDDPFGNRVELIDQG